MDEAPQPEVERDSDLDAIRKLIESQPRRTPAAVAAVVEVADEAPQVDHIADPAAFPALPEPRPKRESRLAPILRSVLGQVKLFLAQPDSPRRLALAMLVLLIILRPWSVLGMALFAVMVGLITYFSLGPDRVAEMVVAWYQRKKKHDPERAEEIRARAARSSLRLGRMIDKLPDSWTQGLYLPDFEESKPLHERLGTDPFDRLVLQREQ